MMKSLKSCLFLGLFLILTLSACRTPEGPSSVETQPSLTENETTANHSFFRKYASFMDDKTGWYYSFTYEQDKDNPSNRVYLFIGLNLRYRYDDDFWSISWNRQISPDGVTFWEKVSSKPGALRFGNGGDAQRRDRAIINTLLDVSRTPEDILALDPGNYQFETIDKNLFFGLIHEALEGDPLPDIGSKDYWMKPTSGTWTEPGYMDGYKFQLAYYMKNAQIDEVYIDVLYKTGDTYNDYVQLSDLVEEGKATAEQEEAFSLIQSIRKGIKEESVFIAASETYMNRTIANIDFSRLYNFLLSVHTNQINDNGVASENPPFIVETYSEEEYNALQGK